MLESRGRRTFRSSGLNPNGALDAPGTRVLLCSHVSTMRHTHRHDHVRDAGNIRSDDPLYLDGRGRRKAAGEGATKSTLRHGAARLHLSLDGRGRREAAGEGDRAPAGQNSDILGTFRGHFCACQIRRPGHHRVTRRCVPGMRCPKMSPNVPENRPSGMAQPPPPLP